MHGGGFRLLGRSRRGIRGSLLTPLVRTLERGAVGIEEPARGSAGSDRREPRDERAGSRSGHLARGVRPGDDALRRLNIRGERGLDAVGG